MIQKNAYWSNTNLGENKTDRRKKAWMVRFSINSEERKKASYDYISKSERNSCSLCSLKIEA